MIQNSLNGKKIILGVTGGIAAYKSALIVRELISRGAEVKVVMTPSATQFITPLTLSTLSKNRVVVSLFPEDQSSGTDYDTWHIEMALWADLILIAPATINTVAKIANGFADNALTTLISALRCPLVVAPAADMDMYNNPFTRENIEKLKKIDAFIVEAEEGFLASGLKGPGRMASTDKILEAVEIVLTGVKKDFSSKKILITAGPTFEDIDPVRFIGNRSSGKMGFALAKAAYLRGADVTLISGPVSLNIYPEIKLIKVRSAADLKMAVEAEIEGKDILIMNAAVADYKPKVQFEKKAKRDGSLNSIELNSTEDILASIKNENCKMIGFALETDNELDNALKKMKAKNIDMIVLNSLQDEGAGFEGDTNKVTVLKSTGDRKDYLLASKFLTANNILTEIKTVL